MPAQYTMRSVTLTWLISESVPSIFNPHTNMLDYAVITARMGIVCVTARDTFVLAKCCAGVNVYSSPLIGVSPIGLDYRFHLSSIYLSTRLLALLGLLRVSLTRE